MVTIRTGDLLKAEETIIAHQVNCCGAAGGLAAAVFEKYTDAENDYYQIIDRCHDAGGQGWALLGIAQFTGQQKDGHIIANLYGQYYPGEDYRPDELEKALKHLAAFAKLSEMSVALPWKLSCGICGGDWNEVLPMIERAMDGVNCVIYRRKGDK
jgi:O-acetyl-ADP-ribose deacetylase (regulator of RNase III)